MCTDHYYVQVELNQACNMIGVFGVLHGMAPFEHMIITSNFGNIFMFKIFSIATAAT
jgi:hypothetical protein